MSGVRRRRRASSTTSFSSPSSLSDSDYIADADATDPDASLLYDSFSRSGHLRPSSWSSSFFSSSSSSSSTFLSTPPSSLRIFLFLIAFRLVNALTVRTFFQPDEFFQSLEPAWRAAFGDDHAPWITWVSFPFHWSISLCTSLRLPRMLVSSLHLCNQSAGVFQD